MNCPKCLENMAPIAFNDICVDRCPRCGGLFFDVTELDRLLGMGDTESIDTAPGFFSEGLDAMPPMNCPRCLQRGMRARMVTLVDADQPDVRFERCPECGGSWLDAGEFNQLRHRTVADFVRGLQTVAGQKGAVG